MCYGSPGWRRPRGKAGCRGTPASSEATDRVLETTLLPKQGSQLPRGLESPGAALRWPPSQSHLQRLCHPCKGHGLGAGQELEGRTGVGAALWEAQCGGPTPLWPQCPQLHDTSYKSQRVVPDLSIPCGKFGRHTQNLAWAQLADTCSPLEKPSAAACSRWTPPLPQPHSLQSRGAGAPLSCLSRDTKLFALLPSRTGAQVWT